MAKFFTFQRYCAPETQDELFAFLRNQEPNARVLAGGTDVFVAMKEKGLRANCVVDIKRIADLRGITPQNGGGLSIGATTTLHAIETSPIVKQMYPVLSSAVGEIGSVQVRNRGTVGGNLCNASPAADSTPALYVLGAQLELASVQQSRTIPVDTFFVGPGKSVMAQGEILRRILIPKPEPGLFATYIKFGPRHAMDIAVVGLAVSLLLDTSGKCRQARVAVASVAPVPLRARQTEAMLIGELNEKRISDAAEQAVAEAKPIDDVRGSADFRKRLIRVLLKRAVEQSLAQFRASLEKN